MCRKIMNRFALLLLLTAAVALMTAGCGKKTDPAGTGQPTGEETVPSGAENESTEDPRWLRIKNIRTASCLQKRMRP